MVSAEVERGLDHPKAASVAYELRGLDGWSQVVDAVCDLLHAVVPCERVVWQSIDARRGTVVVGGDPVEVHDGRTPGEVLLDLPDHPVMNHYVGAVDDRVEHPARLSDLTSQRTFRGTRTYAELFAPNRIRSQLTLVSTLDATTAEVSGWSMNRSSGDFTDAELAVAAALRPLLTTLERDHRAPTPPEPDVPPLTAREVQVLELVAAGLTASAASRRLGISEHTVRRHLEHVYAKCGHHDRLLAVRWAVERGLIAPGIG